MSHANPSSEPTMEEILASIRKIISEDQPEPAQARAPEPAEIVPPLVEEETALQDVHDMVAPPVEITLGMAGLADRFAEPLPVHDYGDDMPFAPMAEPPETYAEEASMNDDLISASTRDALDRAFERIEDAPAPAAPVRTIADSGNGIDAIFARAIQDAFEPTLQGWVDDHRNEIVSRLSPLIREWMDENLPSLIESAVQKEIARAVRSRKR